MVEQRRRDAKDENLHAESERLQKAMVELTRELHAVVADLRDLLSRNNESDDDG